MTDCRVKKRRERLGQDRDSGDWRGIGKGSKRLNRFRLIVSTGQWERRNTTASDGRRSRCRVPVPYVLSRLSRYIHRSPSPLPTHPHTSKLSHHDVPPFLPSRSAPLRTHTPTTASIPPLAPIPRYASEPSTPSQLADLRRTPIHIAPRQLFRT